MPRLGVPFRLKKVDPQMPFSCAFRAGIAPFGNALANEAFQGRNPFVGAHKLLLSLQLNPTILAIRQ